MNPSNVQNKKLKAKKSPQTIFCSESISREKQLPLRSDIDNQDTVEIELLNVPFDPCEDMTAINYDRMEAEHGQDVPRPSGGKQKIVSGKIGAFRRPYWLSITKSESSSVPGAVPLESTTLSDDFRDEVSSLEDKNGIGASTNNHSTEELPKADDFFPGSITLDGVTFNPFGFDPNWDNDATNEKGFDAKAQVREQPEMLGARLEAFEMDNHSKPSSASKTTIENGESQKQLNRPIILIRPSALKFDGWSKVFVRKKDQFKYHSFTNEKRVSRSKQKSKIEPIHHPFEMPIIESRDDTEVIDYRPENFPSFHEFPTELLSTLDDEPVTNNLFPLNVRDEEKCREENTIGPLRPKTTLRLAVQESPRDWSNVVESEERDNFIVDIPPLEPLSNEELDVSPSEVDAARAGNSNRKQKQKNESSDSEEEKSKSNDTVIDDHLEYPSDGDYSTIFSGNTENLPLLKAWQMKLIDCTKCKTKKARKKHDIKKKKAEAKKKLIEDLWERKHFYWRYESVDEKRKQIEELETLVLKIAPETENMPDDGFLEMPLGIQLSTITEGDEDLTACNSPRSTALGAGSLLPDGKPTLNTPIGSLLGDSNEDEEEEDLEAHAQTAQPRGFRYETSGGAERKLPKEESPKRCRKSGHRSLSVDEILVPDMKDEDSTIDSKDGISDITEDYIHIPFSSPLYNKVLKAFRDARN